MYMILTLFGHTLPAFSQVKECVAAAKEGKEYKRPGAQSPLVIAEANDAADGEPVVAVWGNAPFMCCTGASRPCGCLVLGDWLVLALGPNDDLCSTDSHMQQHYCGVWAGLDVTACVLLHRCRG